VRAELSDGLHELRSCRDLLTDRNNCGSCGNVCGSGEACIEGACVLSCPDHLDACGGTCLDLKSDNANCGSCGVSCGSGEVCSNGACTGTCTAPLTKCGNECTDLDSDRDNCGACSNKCADGEGCLNGACTAYAACPSGTAETAAHCWVQGETCTESHSQACGRFGLSPTTTFVDVDWNLSLMKSVADQLGCMALGDTGCCSSAFWTDLEEGTCYTHRFGEQFFNWQGCLGDDLPIVLCEREFP